MWSVRSVIWVAAAALVVGCAPGTPGSDGTTGQAQPSTSTSASGHQETACPPGSTPDEPGAADQARPDVSGWFQLAAMDPTLRAIVVGESGFVPGGAGSSSLQSTWMFDVCTNSWQERGASSLPAPDERPALGQFVMDSAAGMVMGLPVGLAPVWTYDAASDVWRALASTGGGSEAWPIAVYDPDGRRLLAFEAHNSTVKAYDLAADAWSVVEAAGSSGGSSGGLPSAGMDEVDLAYDSVAHLVILVITRPGAKDVSGQTWAFDPATGTWSRRADVPNTLELGYPAGWAAAFDPVSGRTWLFAETAMLSYDAAADEWAVAERGPGWPTTASLAGVEVDPVARLANTMVYDPVNGRLVVIGGLVRRAGDPVGGFEFENSTLFTDDAWAYDPAANSWTLLVPASEHPPSIGPG